jgi:cysteinylglycine-S-conjugate dipeptidase
MSTTRPGVRLWGEGQFSLLERMWTRPALTVIALEARPFLGSSNRLIEAARARLSLRTVPGMDPEGNVIELYAEI